MTPRVSQKKLIFEIFFFYEKKTGPPLRVGMDLTIASFDSISEVNMDYTLTLYLHQYWRDDRLSFADNDGSVELTLSGDFAERIWVPDTL